MDKYDVDGYSYDYRGNSRFPTLNYGIDPTDPNGWELAEIRLRPQYVDNDFDTGGRFQLEHQPRFPPEGRHPAKNYTFSTVELRRASELAVPNFPNGTKIVPVDMTDRAGLKGITGSPDQWVVPDLNAFVNQFDIYSNSGIYAVAPRANNVRSVDEEDRGAT